MNHSSEDSFKFYYVFLYFFLCHSVDENTLPKSGCQRISIVFEHHSYTICLSNKKIYVAKRAIRNVNSQQSTPTTQSAVATTTATASTGTVPQPETKSPNVDVTTGQQNIVHA